MLRICNNYPQPVWVAIMFYHPNCPDGGNWEKRGWWRITTGQCKTVYGGDLDDVNRYWCYYAEADDGATWSGPYRRFLPYQAFSWCEWTASDQGFTAGLRLLDIDSNDNFTLTLVP